MTAHPLSRSQEAALARVVRDIDDGHLAVYRRADGSDIADRQVAGAPDRWWMILADRGLYIPPPAGVGAWQRAR